MLSPAQLLSLSSPPPYPVTSDADFAAVQNKNNLRTFDSEVIRGWGNGFNRFLKFIVSLQTRNLQGSLWHLRSPVTSSESETEAESPDSQTEAVHKEALLGFELRISCLRDRCFHQLSYSTVPPTEAEPESSIGPASQSDLDLLPPPAAPPFGRGRHRRLRRQWSPSV